MAKSKSNPKKAEMFPTIMSSSGLQTNTTLCWLIYKLTTANLRQSHDAGNDM